MSLFGRMFLTAVVWGLVGGICGLLMGILQTTVSPDTGHVPHQLITFFYALVGAALGFLSGLVFGSISGTLGSRGVIHAVAGGAIGAAVIFVSFCAGAIATIASHASFVEYFGVATKPMLIDSIIAAVLGSLLAFTGSGITRGSRR